jgi:hypothetical protein
LRSRARCDDRSLPAGKDCRLRGKTCIRPGRVTHSLRACRDIAACSKSSRPFAEFTFALAAKPEPGSRQTRPPEHALRCRRPR